MHYVQLTLLLLLIGCSGCSLLRIGSLTESAPLNIPSHTGRNQFSGQLGYGGKRGFDGSLSYALTNHIALGSSLFSNQQTFGNNPIPGWTSNFSMSVNSTYWENQVSYYRIINRSSVWAVTGGYGSGSRQIRWLENQLDSKYSRYFIQASGNWVRASNQQVGIGVKLHYTTYASASLSEQTVVNNLVLANAPRGMLGVDIVQTIRLPLSSVLAFTGQYGYYVPLGSGVKLTSPVGYSNNTYKNLGLIATVGLVLVVPAKRQH